MRKPLAEWLDEASEWHSLWYGFFSSFYKLRREQLPKEARKDISREFHYFTLGFFIGRIVQAILVAVGVKFWMFI